ncbi:MAG: hypothetical protein MK095_10130 [Phycisphaerales bacterium]|nr:hypothetical protein [Phycisphaerales bacterium]
MSTVHLFQPDSRRQAMHRLPALLGMVTGCLMLAAVPAMAQEQTPQQANLNTTTDGTPEEIHTVAWPVISLALQDRNASENLSQSGVLNDAWAMSEYAVGSVSDARLSREERIAHNEANFQKFIDMPTTEIQQSLDRYMKAFPQLSRKTTRTIIIDIESPTQPRYFYKLLGGPDHDKITPEFTGIVKAFARRYAVVREAFPNAKLSVFSMGSPGVTVEMSKTDKASLNAEIMAARMGMLQDVDAISPELYERYGPKDALFNSRLALTRQSLERSVQIVQASGQPLDIIVLLSLTVFNAEGHSSLAGKPADLQGLAERLAYLASLGIRRVVFWNGDNTLENTQITVGRRLAQLRTVEKVDQRSPSTPAKPPEDSPGP